MTVRQACFCGFTTLISIIGALGLIGVVVLDVVSIPTPAELVAAHYARAPHNHFTIAVK